MTGEPKPCNFFIQMGKTKKWYGVYTRPKWEKKVFTSLQDKGFEAYCPLNRVRKKWSDRFKLVEEPLFKSYVFVHITEEEQSLIRYVGGIVNFVYWIGKPAVIKTEDIERIKRFLNEHDDVRAESWQPQGGDQVVITSGVMMDLEGTVLSVGKNKVEVKLDSLGCKLVAYISKEKVQKKVF